MKFSTVLASTFAALAAAAPAPALQERAAFNASQLNDLTFDQTDLNYLLAINSLDLTKFQTLGLTNNLNLLIFQELFNAQVFSLGALLQFQQLQTLLAIASTGVFDKLDLSPLVLGAVNLGLIEGIAEVDLVQFIDQKNAPQIEIIADEADTTIIIINDD
ncbi:Fc.00g088410.m01.CDS01 [Cosmosporella sp. VM-42]